MSRVKLKPRPLELYHERTRRRGVNRFVYWPARWIIKPAVLVYFRVRRLGREHIPDGGVILASNHRSFLDPFVVGCCVKRPVFFVAKRELFKNPLVGWFLNSMGAFPVRRGQSDEESVATSLALLAHGQAVVVFPEGTRVPSGSLGRPKRGVGRLALQSGAPVVPVAVTGSERARDGWRIKPVRVHVRCGPPLTFPKVARPSPILAGAVTDRIWPCVQLQWEWLGGLPPLRTAAIVGADGMGTALATVLTRAGLDVQLGCRTEAQAEAVRAERVNRAHLPDVELDRGIEITTAAELEFAGVDLVVLAVPCAALPAVLDELGMHVSERAAVLVTSKGLVPPLGTTPSAFVSERVHARAIATLAVPVGSGEVVQRRATGVVATRDADLRRQLRDVLQAGGLTVADTDDVTGVELAACAKTAAALATSAAARKGAGVAGAAADRICSEVQALALASGARSETFRAAGTPAAGTDSLATLPLLALALERQGIDAPATTGLRRVLAGERTPDEWLDSLGAGRPTEPTPAR
ncbi:MAG TPA: 1-acylglycerol-3-phosphate O-acyltransferase [Thermoleophilaceae bacterium]|nr:1-acylglycerol-3-phosphate O-acyltransferase [Thermoleophilaceae bacterium]